MREYTFKLKRGDLEVQLKSSDAAFIETQMRQWQEALGLSATPPSPSVPTTPSAVPPVTASPHISPYATP